MAYSNKTKIKLSDLRCDTIKPKDIQKLKKSVSGIRNKNIVNLLLILLFDIISILMLLDAIKNSSIKNIIFISFMTIIFLVATIYFLLKIINSKLSSVKHCQYGIVTNKYKINAKQKRNSYYKYYLTVSFLEESTYITNVLCLKSDFNSLNLNDSVLVYSFDDKKSYGITS